MDEIDKIILNGLAEGKDIKQIAEITGLKPCTIYGRIKRMRERGIEIPKVKLDIIDMKILEKLRNGETRSKVAKILGLSESTIYIRINKMRKLGVEIPNNSNRESYERDKIILNGLAEGKDIKQIAEITGLKPNTIYIRIYKMRKKGIEIPELQLDIIDEKILKGLSKEKTQTEIAQETGINYGTIHYRIKNMRKRGIEIPKAELDNTDKIILEELSNGKTQTEIAQETGINYGTICYRIKNMREKGIEIPKVTKVSRHNKKKETDAIDEKIYDLKEEGLSFREIAKECKNEGIEMSHESARRKYLKVKASEQELAKAIIKLIKSKNATLEQIQVMADYYGIDLNRTFDSLDEQER